MSIVLSIVLILFASLSHAMNEGDMRFGMVGGNVALLGDVGSGGQNALGIGGHFRYQLLDDIAFHTLYLQSHHNNINTKHSDISLGVDYYTGGDETVAFYASMGAALLSNNFSLNPANDSSAMALYLGAGIDFQIAPKFLFGLKFKYNKAFEAAVGPVKTVQDTIEVFAIAEFVIGKK